MRMVGLVSISLILLTTSGCFTRFVFVRQRHPVLYAPKRPELQNIKVEELVGVSVETKKKITDNYEDLIQYSKQLEVAVDEYNKFAKEQNDKSEFYNNIDN